MESILFGVKERKKCSHCKQWLHLDSFGIQRRYNDGLNYICKECKNSIAREYNNLPTSKERKRRYRLERKDTEEYKAYHRDRQKMHYYKKSVSERRDYANRPSAVESRAKYRKSQKGRATMANYSTRTRFYRDFEIIGVWSESDIKRQFICQDGRCFGCLRKFGDDLKFQMDHNLPVIRGGTCTRDNLLLLCKSCNSSKGSKTFTEWESL